MITPRTERRWSHLWHLLIVVLLLSACQPVTPAAVSIQPSYPALAPAGVPPVVGDGALAVLPAAPDGTLVPVTTELGRGWVVTVLMPAQASASLAVRIQAGTPGGPSAPAFEAGDAASTVFSIQVYDATTGEIATQLATPLSVAVRPPSAAQPGDLAVWAYSEATDRYDALPLSLDEARRVLAVELPALGSHRVAVGPKVAAAAETDARVLPLAPLPARLVIPSIQVDAPVAPVGREPSGIMAAPTEGHIVGWYELGARPGERSNAVLTGHVDWQRQPAVFQRLAELRAGDIVDVDTGLGTAYRYVVREVTTYRADSAPVAEIFGSTEDAVLTLITCAGPFDAARDEYPDRLVVRAHAE